MQTPENGTSADGYGIVDGLVGGAKRTVGVTAGSVVSGVNLDDEDDGT